MSAAAVDPSSYIDELLPFLDDRDVIRFGVKLAAMRTAPAFDVNAFSGATGERQERFTLCGYAAYHGHSFCLAYLTTEHGVDVNCTSFKADGAAIGVKPLMVAVGCSNLRCVQALLPFVSTSLVRLMLKSTQLDHPQPYTVDLLPSFLRRIASCHRDGSNGFALIPEWRDRRLHVFNLLPAFIDHAQLTGLTEIFEQLCTNDRPFLLRQLLTNYRKENGTFYKTQTESGGDDILTALDVHDEFVTDRVDRAAETMLQMATRKGMTEIVEVLLEFCAAGDATDDDAHDVQTALRQSIERGGKRDCTKMLYEHETETKAKRARIDAAAECVICKSARATFVLRDCGHLCLCADCKERMPNREKKCPVCRAKIVGMLRVYS